MRILFIQDWNKYYSYACAAGINHPSHPGLPGMQEVEGTWQPHVWAQRWAFACWSRGLQRASLNVKFQSLPRVLHNIPCLFINSFFFFDVFSLQILFAIKMHIVSGWDWTALGMRYLFLFGAGSHICGLWTPVFRSWHLIPLTTSCVTPAINSQTSPNPFLSIYLAWEWPISLQMWLWSI